MTFGLKILGKKILVQEYPSEKKEGILIVPNEKKGELTVKVLAVGDDIPIQPGQNILIKMGWMHRFKFNNQDVVLIPIEDVIGIISEAI